MDKKNKTQLYVTYKKFTSSSSKWRDSKMHHASRSQKGSYTYIRQNRLIQNNKRPKWSLYDDKAVNSVRGYKNHKCIYNQHQVPK